MVGTDPSADPGARPKGGQLTCEGAARPSGWHQSDKSLGAIAPSEGYANE